MRHSRKWLSRGVLAIAGAAVALTPWRFASAIREASTGVAFAQGAVAAQKLTASDGAAGDQFGQHVELSGDTALVVADQESSVYVFVRSGTTWLEQQKLSGWEREPNYGDSVQAALSGDTAIIGTALDDDRATDAGAAYVFVRTDGAWTLQQKLTAPDASANDVFGCNVALSGDTAIIGAMVRDELGRHTGAAYVFLRTAGTWSLQQKLASPEPAEWGEFGAPVALSGDTALVGEFGTHTVHVYVRTAGTWSRQGALRAWDGTAEDSFGADAALSGDTAIVGAMGDVAQGGGSTAGAAYVFVRNAGIWSQQQKLTDSDGATRWFGRAVALSGDTALVAAMKNDAPGYWGAALEFARDSGTWSQQQKLTAPDGTPNVAFACDIALSGHTALIGALGDDDNGDRSGSAWVWRLDKGQSPLAELGPADIAFARTATGRQSPVTVLTLSNAGASDLHVTSVSTAGRDPGDFVASAGGPTPAPSMSPTVAPGASVTFAVTFAPASGGTKSAMVRITSDDPYEPAIDVPLHGDAVACVASPTTGTIGTVVSVQGAGFGTKRGRLLVVGGKKPLALRVTRWNVGNDGLVRGVIEGPLPPGAYHVCVAPPRAARIVDSSVFTFAAPAIAGVSPSGGPRGTEVALTCTALGTTKGSVFLQAPGAKKRVRCTVTAWPRDAASGTGHGEARFRVPKKLIVGTAYDVVVVTKVGEARAAGAFTAAP